MNQVRWPAERRGAVAGRPDKESPGAYWFQEGFAEYLSPSTDQPVKDAATGTLTAPADYSQLGDLLIVQLVIALALPFTAILIARHTRFRSA